VEIPPSRLDQKVQTLIGMICNIGEMESLLKEMKYDANNDFYTRIPHDFGMRVPPMIRTLPEMREKMKLLEVIFLIWDTTCDRILEQKKSKFES